MFSRSVRPYCRNGLFRAIFCKQELKKYVPVSYFSSTLDSPGDFKPIFKYPLISIGAALNKIKKLQIVGTSIAIPGAFVTNAISPSICDLPTAMTICGAGIASTVAVCLIGQVFSNMIGFVYVSPDLQTVRFSYLDFWGGRKNVDFPREELMPLDNSASYPTNILYTKVYRYSSTKPHKINIKSGEILNTEAFKYIFKPSPN